MAYHEFVQWLADRQLGACQAEARGLGLPVGLYIDLAVGVEPGGADAWSAQDSVVQQVEIGAPPDLLNTAGQAWGLAALNPQALEAQAFAPFAELLVAAMRHAGAIRLDHVLGLNRLFLIPFDMTAKEGAYVRYPLQALLAVVALESVRHRCLVIGEDLGTVPEELRGILADWGIWSYLVMLFERTDQAAFKLPHEYRQNALVTFSTHDLPTFEGWRTNHDLRVKWGIELDPGESEDARHRAHSTLREALERSGLGSHVDLKFIDIARFLARTPSRLMVVQIEDVLRIADQPNVPGTLDEHPNWRRRLPVDLEDLVRDERLSTLASALAEEGRSASSVRQDHRAHESLR
jgi:4-alpha-glucanotransferase